MIDGDWADVIAFARRGERRVLDFTLSTRLLADSTPIDQYQQIKDGDKADAFADEVYLADALEPKLTEVGRLAVVAYCLRDNFSTYGEGPGNAVRWGMCQPDLDHFDPKKLAVQVRGDTAHTGAERMGIRFAADAVAAPLAAHAAKITKLFAQDPAYKMIPSFDKRPFGRAKSASGSSYGGVVKTMKPAGKMLAITVEETKQTFWGCVKEDPAPHFTGYRVDGSGNVLATHDHICLEAGPVTQTNTWQPFSVDKTADTDAFVKVGTTISCVGNQVIATWSSKLAQTPTSLLGVALK